MALTAKKVYAILKRQISDMEAKLNSPVRYRGTVATADLLPLNPDIGDMYNIESKSVYGEAGMNVAWNGVVWDTMGAPIDMSLYLTKEEAETVMQRLVTEYFEKNPVKPGATTEQAQQIEQNKTDIASLKTETGSLKEDISTKITKFYASSQGETHLADSDNGKIMDMMLYGKSEQKRYSGKNLLNATLQTTTQNGVTCTANGDGTYTINGTATSDTLFHIGYFIFEKDTKYKIVGCPQGGSLNTLYRLDGSLNANSDTGNGIVYSGDGNKRNARIVVFNGATVDNLLFKPMITTDLTATYDDFEPYTGGIPSPNPDYPQEIKSVANPTVKVCGKNLFKATLGNVTANGITCTANSDGTYILNGTCTVSTALSKIGIFDHILNEPLYLTGVPSGCGSYLALARYDGNNILVTDGKNTKIDAGIHTKHIEFWITKGTTLNNVIFKPMLTTDLTATYDDFEPYHEQTVTLPYTLNAIPVNSGGNVTIDGQQYIADYVDVERGKLVRMVGECVISDMNQITRITTNTFFVYGMDDVFVISDNSDDIARLQTTKYQGVALVDRTDNKYIYRCWLSTHDNLKPIAFHSNTDDLSAFKNEVYGTRIIYQLANPTEIDLAPEEIAAFKSLATYYPVTNIFINSEQLDGYTVFNYPISMENGWNYVKQQIGDTRNYIYDMDARTQDTDLQAAEAYVNSEYAVALTELEV